MLWAIDAGNTHVVVGVYDDDWRALWRLSHAQASTEDALAAALSGLCAAAGLPFRAEGLCVASVAPQLDVSFQLLGERWLDVEPRFLRTGADVGLEVTYDPPHAVGADRVANAIAALEIWDAPLAVVDFGTATTFDCVDDQGRYAGGAIMPGVNLGVEALARHTAKLPQVRLEVPNNAVGRNTDEALRSGVVLGYAEAVEGIAKRVKSELGPGTRLMSTGGLGKLFADLCPSIERHEPMLTLEGLRMAWPKLT